MWSKTNLHNTLIQRPGLKLINKGKSNLLYTAPLCLHVIVGYVSQIYLNCALLCAWCHYVSVVARKIFKEFPEARQVDKETPYNERRKMGHFSWTINESSEKLIVNFYVVHKVCKHFPLYKHFTPAQQLKCVTQTY